MNQNGPNAPQAKILAIGLGPARLSRANRVVHILLHVILETESLHCKVEIGNVARTDARSSKLQQSQR